MEYAQLTIYMFTLSVCIFVIGFLILEGYRIKKDSDIREQLYKKYPELKKK